MSKSQKPRLSRLQKQELDGLDRFIAAFIDANGDDFAVLLGSFLVLKEANKALEAACDALMERYKADPAFMARVEAARAKAQGAIQ